VSANFLQSEASARPSSPICEEYHVIMAIAWLFNAHPKRMAKSWWPGVSSRLKASHSCSKLITAEDAEMPPLALDRHPIRARPPLFAARLNLARQLDRAAKKQQLLSEGRLAGRPGAR
jgi:hypothetical protein